MCRHYWVISGPTDGMNTHTCKYCNTTKTTPELRLGIKPAGDGDWWDAEKTAEYSRRGQDAKNKALGIGIYGDTVA